MSDTNAKILGSPRTNPKMWSNQLWQALDSLKHKFHVSFSKINKYDWPFEMTEMATWNTFDLRRMKPELINYDVRFETFRTLCTVIEKPFFMKSKKVLESYKHLFELSLLDNGHWNAFYWCLLLIHLQFYLRCDLLCDLKNLNRFLETKWLCFSLKIAQLTCCEIFMLQNCRNSLQNEQS